jgi:hypothetical protein
MVKHYQSSLEQKVQSTTQSGQILELILITSAMMSCWYESLWQLMIIERDGKITGLKFGLQIESIKLCMALYVYSIKK